MPNNIVFNEVAEQLKVQIYGTDGSNVLPLATDDSGNVTVTAEDFDIRQLTASDTITVTAEDFDIRQLTASDTITVTAEDFDIRQLTASDTITVTAEDFDIRQLTASDTITVTAEDFDIRQLTASDTITVTAEDFDIRGLSGATDSVIKAGCLFTEDSNTITGASGTGIALTIDTSQFSDYSFYIRNNGTDPVDITLQVSPSNVNDYYVDDSTSVNIGADGKKVITPKYYLKHTRIYYDVPSGTADIDVYFNGHA